MKGGFTLICTVLVVATHVLQVHLEVWSLSKVSPHVGECMQILLYNADTNDQMVHVRASIRDTTYIPL